VEFSEARLGLEAQKKAVSDYLGGGAGDLSGEFLEIESGRRNDRPQLAAALQACRQHRATLVIAKLDRLARDAHFLLGLEKAGVDFVACDLPAANRLMLGILALVAEDEARAISARTKAALAAAKARGTVLGTPANLTNFQLGIRNSANVRMAAAQRRAYDLQPLIEDYLKKAGISSPTSANGTNATCACSSARSALEGNPDICAPPSHFALWTLNGRRPS
jgi:DNA invertase Pin-like site-specific DNA recombinase